ncbi:MAG: fluoride efflux transporter FluC [Actinomycetota bacterium]
MSRSELGPVAAGGAVGTLARYGALDHFPVGRDTFPTTTLIVNLVASLLLGFLLARLASSARYKALLVPGVVGGLGTLSLVVVEAAMLVADGAADIALAYVGATILGGIVLVVIGEWLGGHRRFATSMTREEMP